MAAAYVQSASVTSTTAGATIAKAYASALTNQNLVVAIAFWQAGAGSTCSVADPTNGAWTPIGSPINADGVGNLDLAGFSAQAFYLKNTATTAVTVTATVSTSVTGKGLAIHEYSGVNTLATHHEAAVGADLTPTPSSVTPAESNDLIFDWIVCSGSESAIDSSFTIREKTNFGNNGTADLLNPTSGVAVAPTWTCSDSVNMVGNVVFKAGATTDTVSPSGTVTFSGSDVISVTVPAGTGTITLAGTKTSSISRTKAVSGTLTLTGSTTVLLTQTITPSGSFVFGGSISAVQTPGGSSFNAGSVLGSFFLSSVFDVVFKRHGWGLIDSHSPVSRVERAAAGAAPIEDVLVNPDDELAWGTRLATEPQSRTASRAAGGEATSITEPDEALVWAWRKKNDQTP